MVQAQSASHLNQKELLAHLAHGVARLEAAHGRAGGGLLAEENAQLHAALAERDRAYGELRRILRETDDRLARAVAQADQLLAE